MSRGTDFPVTLARLPLKLRAMQWTGLNEQAIQDELAGQAFKAKDIACDEAGCSCGAVDHPEITAELRNDFTETMQGMETGWWVCMTEDGKLFPASGDIIVSNYVME